MQLAGSGNGIPLRNMWFTLKQTGKCVCICELVFVCVKTHLEPSRRMPGRDVLLLTDETSCNKTLLLQIC